MIPEDPSTWPIARHASSTSLHPLSSDSLLTLFVVEFFRAMSPKAQHLMVASEQPLASMALASGFADQSHFTRTFRRIVGVTPTAWLKAQSLRAGALAKRKRRRSS